MRFGQIRIQFERSPRCLLCFREKLSGGKPPPSYQKVVGIRESCVSGREAWISLNGLPKVVHSGLKFLSATEMPVKASPKISLVGFGIERTAGTKPHSISRRQFRMDLPRDGLRDFALQKKDVS